MKVKPHLLIAIVLSILPSLTFAGTFNLSKQRIQKVGKTTCGLPKGSNKWSVVKRIGQSSIYATVSKPSKTDRARCAALLKPSSLKSLVKIPSNSALTHMKQVTSSRYSLAQASAEPPALTEIADLGISIFWTGGVIEGFQSHAPTQAQCDQFWGSATDGESGGYLACTMAEDVGYAFEPIQRASTSRCYMQNFPTQAVFDSGAIVVNSGELPGGDITKLLSVPEGNEARIVKVHTNGDDAREIFMKIFPVAQNNTSGYQYHAKIWFCGQASESAPVAVLSSEDITVSFSGVLTSVNRGSDQYGTYSSRIVGALTYDAGQLVFDSSKERSAQIRYVSVSDQNHFNAELEIGGNGLISQKFLNAYGGVYSKRYTVSRVGGDSLEDLRFYEGAFKELRGASADALESFSAATEYRDSGYRSNPGSELMSSVSSYDFTDPFYSEILDVEEIDSSLTCDTVPDVDLSLDMSNGAMVGVVDACEANNKQTSNFCRENDALKDAIQHFADYCGS